MSLNDWVNHKNELRKRSKNIKISMDNLSIKSGRNSATASFIQYYSSSISKKKKRKEAGIKKDFKIMENN